MARLGPESWLSSAVRRLARGGVDDLRIEVLARDLGVSKGSFYWHFADRQALLDALLVWWEREGTVAIIGRIEELDGDAADRLRALVDIVFGQPERDGVEVGIRAWAARDEPVALVVERVDATRIDYLAGLLTGCGLPPQVAALRAQLVYRTMVGDFTVHATGGTRLSTAAVDELVELTLG